MPKKTDTTTTEATWKMVSAVPAGRTRDKQSARLTVALELDAAEATKVCAAGASREPALRQRVDTLLRQTDAFKSFEASAARLKELLANTDRLRDALRQVADNLREPMGTQKLIDLSKREAEARDALSATERALVHARAARDADALALLAVAREVATSEKLVVLTGLTPERDRAGAEGDWSALLALAQFTGILRRPDWSGLVAIGLVEKIIGGPIPPQPPPPIQPEPPRHPFAVAANSGRDLGFCPPSPRTGV